MWRAAIGLDESLRRHLSAEPGGPAVEVRPKVMFNPDSRSPNFFLPGLDCRPDADDHHHADGVFRGSGKGTGHAGAVDGHAGPAPGADAGQDHALLRDRHCRNSVLLLFMRFAFRVPDSRQCAAAGRLTSGYLFVNLALGMLIQRSRQNQGEAMQSAMALMLPSIFLSGFMFPARDHAAVAFIGRLFGACNLHDRNCPGSDPARSWADRIVGQRSGAVRHGSGIAAFGGQALQEYDRIKAERKRA